MMSLIKTPKNKKFAGVILAQNTCKLLVFRLKQPNR